MEVFTDYLYFTTSSKITSTYKGGNILMKIDKLSNLKILMCSKNITIFINTVSFGVVKHSKWSRMTVRVYETIVKRLFYFRVVNKGGFFYFWKSNIDSY